jgi:hypothetical protein
MGSPKFSKACTAPPRDAIQQILKRFSCHKTYPLWDKEGEAKNRVGALIILSNIGAKQNPET